MTWVDLSQAWEHPPGLEVVRADFMRVLAETGTSVELSRARVTNPDTQRAFPVGFEFLEVRPSVIHGLGLFTTKAIAQGEVIGPAVIEGRRTPLGRYVNHSPMPNTASRPLPGGEVVSFALVALAAGAEILNNYRQNAALSGFEFDPLEVSKTLAFRVEALTHGFRGQP